MPIISVIYPIYKVENYIQKSILSIIEQSFTDFEIILIDDNGKDNSTTIALEELKKNNFINYQLITNEKNIGVSASRNKALKKAKGKYITFIDSDDIVHQDLLKVLYKIILQNNCEIASAELLGIENSKLANTTSKIKIEKTFHFTGEEACLKIFEYAILKTEITGKLIDSNLFKDYSFNEKLRLGEDTVLLLQILGKTNKIVQIENALYYYIKRSDSATNHINYQYIEGIYDFIDTLKRSVKENNNYYKKAFLRFEFNYLYKTFRDIQNLQNTKEEKFAYYNINAKRMKLFLDDLKKQNHQKKLRTKKYLMSKLMTSLFFTKYENYKLFHNNFFNLSTFYK